MERLPDWVFTRIDESLAEIVTLRHVSLHFFSRLTYIICKRRESQIKRIQEKSETTGFDIGHYTVFHEMLSRTPYHPK